MPQPTKGPRLGGGPAHERLMLANLAAALYTHKSIKTTETKAKRLRPLAERLITFAKRGDLHSRRRVLSVIHDKSVVHELFTEIAPLVAEREGGYTRITKVGFRKGDNAPLAVIELVLEPVVAKRRATKSQATKSADAPLAESSSKGADDDSQVHQGDDIGGVETDADGKPDAEAVADAKELPGHEADGESEAEVETDADAKPDADAEKEEPHKSAP